MCFGCSWFKRHLFLVTQACEMSIFVTRFTLILLGRTLKTFHMSGIPTLGTFSCTCMGLVRIKHLLVWWHLLLTCILFVTGWPWLERLFLLLLAWWEVCMLVSHQIDLAQLGVTCNLFDVICCCLWSLYFLCKLSDFACRKLFKTYASVIDDFRHTFFIFLEKPKDVKMQDDCSFLWVFSKTHLSLYCIVSLIHRSVTLVVACKQVKSCSTFIHLGLAKLIILGPKGIQSEVISGQTPRNIVIYPKITTPRYDFLVLLWLKKHYKFTI